MLKRLFTLIERYQTWLLVVALSVVSVAYFRFYLNNGLGLNYNDARSHLDIGRRVVEGLKPGLAQLGSVWLPLNHLLMVPLIWNDWFWHSGLAGAIWNMMSFVGTGVVINIYLKRLQVGWLGRLVGVLVFVVNLNILYLQSTAMTELLLIFTMTVGCYHLLRFHQADNLLDLIKAALWIMLSTLTRYDGWFLLGFAGLLLIRHLLATYARSVTRKELYYRLEGVLILFTTLAGAGIVGWFLWNQLIFGDALYFILGPFSAHAQQTVMEAAGSLPTKHNFWLSLKVYFYALLYSSYTYPFVLAVVGMIVLWRDRLLTSATKWGSLALTAPLFFNILALYLGFSVIFVQGISGESWFNIRYGTMLAPTIAILVGYLLDRARHFRLALLGTLAFVLFFAMVNQDSVSLDDARVGSSQKNVSEVSAFLAQTAKIEPGFVLISAASHDAIIFSSGMPMRKFIHEGTGQYWLQATTMPEAWARYIVMRTYDDNDLVWAAVSRTPGFAKYDLVESYPFASVYRLRDEYLPNLNTTPSIPNNK